MRSWLASNDWRYIMTSIVKFQSLSGIGDESPHCYILQIDDFKFLLDCGWEERNGSFILDNLRYHAKQIDAILISHPGKFIWLSYFFQILLRPTAPWFFALCRWQARHKLPDLHDVPVLQNGPNGNVRSCPIAPGWWRVWFVRPGRCGRRVWASHWVET